MSDMDKDIELEVEKVEEKGIEVVEAEQVDDKVFCSNIANIAAGGNLGSMLEMTVALGAANYFNHLKNDENMTTSQAITVLIFGEKLGKKIIESQEKSKKERAERKNEKSAQVEKITPKDYEKNGEDLKLEGLSSLLFALSYGADLNGAYIDPNSVLRKVDAEIEKQGGIENTSITGATLSALGIKVPDALLSKLNRNKSEQEASQTEVEQDVQSPASESTFADKIASDAKKGDLPLRTLWALDMLNKGKQGAGDESMDSDGMDDGKDL